MRKRKLTALLIAFTITFTACTNTDTNPPKSSTSSQTQDSINNNTSGNTEEKLNELYNNAIQDSVFAEESEIQPLVALTKEDKLVSWDKEGRVLLCTWHNYPDSYPEGEKVTIAWGPVWTFTDKEITSYKDEFTKAQDKEMRFRQLIAFAPDSEHSTVTGFWVDPKDVKRPAYQSDPTDETMQITLEENVDEAFKAWFDENILNSYFYGAYPWTRLGYTYDWADNGKEYGLTEFIVNQGAEVEVEFTETTQEFFQRLSEK